MALSVLAGLWRTVPVGLVASQLPRWFQFKADRASILRWAFKHILAPAPRNKPVPKPIMRWLARDYGALWQYDATPHNWLPDHPDKQVLLNTLDDTTRLNNGARLYTAGSLLAHFDFLSRVFQFHGLPLALCVNYHSFFHTHNPDAFYQLGQVLRFCGVRLLFAPTPQVKGKIERRHDYWQKRLVPLLAAERILELTAANRLLGQLLPHANRHEIRRKLSQPPHAARQQVLSEKRSVIPPAPQCPWCPHVWSQQTRFRFGDDGKVRAGS